MKSDQPNRSAAAAAERRAQDAAALVARVRTSKQSFEDIRVYAPKDLGIPTVEIAQIDLPDRIRLLPDRAEELGRALIEAARKARE